MKNRKAVTLIELLIILVMLGTVIVIAMAMGGAFDNSPPKQFQVTIIDKVHTKSYDDEWDEWDHYYTIYTSLGDNGFSTTNGIFNRLKKGKRYTISVKGWDSILPNRIVGAKEYVPR